MLARSAYRCLCSGNSPMSGRQYLLQQAAKSTSPLTIRTVFVRWAMHQRRHLNTQETTDTIVKIRDMLFGKYLLATNTIGSGVLMVLGDMAAQEIEYLRNRSGDEDDDGDRYDKKRTWRMFVVGAMQGPIHHYVYNWMETALPAHTVRNTIRKILIDELFMSPVCILLFFYSACFLEDKSVKETNEELLHKLPIIYLADWLVWPPVQFINFYYMPLKYRVMYVNVITALYNVFVSYMKHEYHAPMEDRTTH